MIKMQTALLILTVFIACLYFSAKRKNDINADYGKRKPDL